MLKSMYCIKNEGITDEEAEASKRGTLYGGGNFTSASVYCH